MSVSYRTLAVSLAETYEKRQNKRIINTKWVIQRQLQAGNGHKARQNGVGIYLNPDNEGFREAVDSEILAYMTGILPIKKYGSHKVNSDEVRREYPLGGSAGNMFTEFSMTNLRILADYVGFTEEEVMDLCNRYGMDFDEACCL